MRMPRINRGFTAVRCGPYLCRLRVSLLAFAFAVGSLALACGPQGQPATSTPPPPSVTPSQTVAPEPQEVDPAPSDLMAPVPVASLIRTTRFIWPYEGSISSYFGPGHALGIDIAIDVDESPVRASAAGTVTFAGGEACCEYGYHVAISHFGGMTTLYAHLSSFAVVEGQTVAQGEVVGLSGQTGKTDGPHLHFELHDGEGLVDPLRFLPKAGTSAREESSACDGDIRS